MIAAIAALLAKIPATRRTVIANAALQKARQPEREALKQERDRLLRDATTPTPMTTLLEF